MIARHRHQLAKTVLALLFASCLLPTMDWPVTMDATETKASPQFPMVQDFGPANSQINVPTIREHRKIVPQTSGLKTSKDLKFKSFMLGYLLTSNLGVSKNG